ncbi:mitochondrial large subunit ribosomal protein-domain-containing protein [Xylaria sp. FL1042]|nr:mitochondrial large subunit ribosomal protein-domain-containing protein [Xylaria sp. FL1042]
MFSRSLRPLTSRATSFAAKPVRSSAPLGPLSIRTLTNTTVLTPAAPATSPETNTARVLPYFVGRNTLNNLSVYTKNKRGGNLKLTILKHGEGDLVALKQDIKDALKLHDNAIAINGVTKHIVIKGSKRDEIMNFLHTMGF